MSAFLNGLAVLMLLLAGILTARIVMGVRKAEPADKLAAFALHLGLAFMAAAALVRWLS